jgi:hypothetical protein
MLSSGGSVGAPHGRSLGPALLLLTIGCGSGKGTLEGEGEGDGGGSGEVNLDGDEFDGPGPIGDEGQIWCESSGGSAGNLFFITVAYDDPQGPADVQRGDVTAAWADDGVEVWTAAELLVCLDFDCEGSFREDVATFAPVACSRVDDFVFTATLRDRSGNQSDPIPLEIGAP